MKITCSKHVVDRYGQRVAKRNQEIFDVLEKYFKYLQDGTYLHLTPDPFYTEVDMDLVNRIIYAIDKDFLDKEFWRISNGYYIALPEFSRLTDEGKLAMAQEIHKIIKYQRSHIEEYIEEVEDVGGVICV